MGERLQTAPGIARSSQSPRDADGSYAFGGSGRARGANAAEAGADGNWLTRRSPVLQSWEGLRPFTPRARRELLVISLSAVVSGFAQAGALYLLVETSVALAKGSGGLLEGSGSVVRSLRLTAPTAILLGLALIGAFAAMSVVQARITARMMTNAQTEVRRRLVHAFLAASWDLQSAERVGNLQELTNTYSMRTSDGVGQLATGATALFNLFALILAAILINPIGTLVIVSGTILVSALLRPLLTHTRSRAALQSRLNASFAVLVAEIVRLAQEIRVFGVTATVDHNVDDATAEAGEALTRTRFLLRIGPGVYQSLMFGLVFVAMGAISLAHISGVAALGAVVILLVRGLLYGQQLQQSQQGSAEIIPYIHAVRDQIINLESGRIVDGSRNLESIQFVEFNTVSFSYDAEKPALQDLNFQISRGQALGVVGPTGAGKSTLVQLLLRLRVADTGEYRINGELAQQYSLEDLYREVAFVPQEPQLIRGTVADNIRFFRNDISEERIHHAATVAHLNEAIESWDGGYGREIGDGAASLSGGQKQLLSMARALAGNPSMIILDEPTSGLDAQSELLVRHSLGGLKGNVIMVIIAHRLSTLEFCDRIMVLEDGSITALGSNAELSQTSPFLRVAHQLSALPTML